MAHDLTPEQRELVAKLAAEVAETVKANTSLQHFCNDHCYVRYLRARSWNLVKATKMLKATLEWRLTYKPHEIRWEQVKHESVTGKQMVFDFPDKDGRPIVLMRTRFENTKEPESQVRFLIYHLEMASRQADASGVGKMTWLIDFNEYSMRNAPAIKTSMHVLNTLQNHYPERLGCAICFHAPTLFSLTWRAVGPFIDPVTKEKIHFIDNNKQNREKMGERFDLTKMEQCMCGDVEGYIFNLEEYERRCKETDAQLEAELKAVEKTQHMVHNECSDSAQSLAPSVETALAQKAQSLSVTVETAETQVVS